MAHRGLLALVVAAALGVAADAKACSYHQVDLQCSGLGEPCQDAANPPHICADRIHTVCMPMPGGHEKICQKAPAFASLYQTTCVEFGDCTSDVDSLFLYGASCKDSKCQLIAGVPGDFCTTGDECVSGLCVNNRCRGETENEYCNMEGQCEIGFYCDTKHNRCALNKQEGDPCTHQSGECAKGLFCDGSYCRTPFSLDDGAPAPLNSEYVCSSGFAMDAPSVCATVEEGREGEQCDPSDTVPGYICECSSDNVYELRQEFFEDQREVAVHMAECMSYSPCHPGSDPKRVGSCNYYYCSYQLRSQLCSQEVVSGGDIYKFSELPTCLEDEYEAFLGSQEQCMSALVHSCANLPGVNTFCVETDNMGTNGGVVAYTIICAVFAFLAPTITLWVNHCRRTGMIWDPRGFVERSANPAGDDYAATASLAAGATTYGASADATAAENGAAAEGQSSEANSDYVEAM